MTMTPTTLPITHLSFIIPEVHCLRCTQSIERHLIKKSYVHAAQVNLTQKKLYIQVDPKIDSETIVGNLSDIGFSASPAHQFSTSDENKIRSQQLLMRIGVASFALMNVMLLSVSVWSGAEASVKYFFESISALIAIPSVLYCATPFFSSALTALKNRRLGMDVPISAAILLTLLNSVFETINFGKHVYFDAALSLCLFLLIGRYLEAYARNRVRSAAAELSNITPKKINRDLNGQLEEVDIEELAHGDILIVYPGERIPCDGQINTGISESDRSILTGESSPITLIKGSLVYAGEINLTGRISIICTKKPSESALSRFIELIELAENTRNKYTALADVVAKIYTPLIHIIALLTLVIWIGFGSGISTAINVAISVLIISCPCALGLAAPTVMTVSTNKLFRKNILLNNPNALEKLSKVDTVVFDKTGTLTSGHRPLDDFDKWTEYDRALLGTLSSSSSHPFSKSISIALNMFEDIPLQVENIVEVPGLGIRGHYRGREIRLGRPSWVSQTRQCNASISNNRPIVAFTNGQDDYRMIKFEESVKPETSSLILKIKKLGLKVVMLTGDTRGAASKIATYLNIDDYHAQKLPEEKLKFIEQLQNKGNKILMVGDGINDAGALAAAYVSLSPSNGLDIIRTSADITLIGKSPLAIVEAISLAKQATRRIKENFYIAAAYNSLAIPTACIGLITPLYAAIAMSTSSLLVSLNAFRQKVR